jgi:hypothetical protein
VPFDQIKALAENWFKPQLEERREGFHRLTQLKLGEITSRGWGPSPSTYAALEKLAYEEIEQRAHLVLEAYKEALTASRERVVPLMPQIKADVEAVVTEESIHVRQGIQYVFDFCKPPSAKDAAALRARVLQKLTAELDFFCYNLHNERNEGVPILPVKPTSVKVTEFRIYEQGQLSTQQALELLILRLFREPEVVIKYYYQDGTPIDPLLTKAIHEREIIAAKSEWRFFKHPEIAHDYIQLSKENDDEERDNEAERTPEFVELILELSGHKRMEMETFNKIDLEERYRERLRQAKYDYDIFLSYSDRNKDRAEIVHGKLSKAGQRVFMAPKELSAGDDFADEIRKALVGSRELWLLVSPNSIKSEWVISEWGAAWMLQKRIVPILFRCSHADLPERLRRLHCVDLDMLDEHIAKVFPPMGVGSKQGDPNRPPATEATALLILVAVTEEYERDPSLLTCRVFREVIAPTMAKHRLSASDIDRGIRFLVSKRFLNAISRQDGQAIQPTTGGLEYLSSNKG